MPPSVNECIFSEILSLPLIFPDCSTLTAWSTAEAPRGMTIDPLTLTGSSTSDLNVLPANEASTSMSCVSRTLIAVPDGTVTVGGGAGAGAGAAACGVGAGFGAGGGGLGAGLRAENSTDSASSIGISDTCPLSSSTRTVLLSAPMNMPSTTLPERSFTRSAESV